MSHLTPTLPFAFAEGEGGTYAWARGAEPGGWCDLPWVRSNIGLNDIHVFALAMHQDQSLTQRWLALSSASEWPRSRLSGMCAPAAVGRAAAGARSVDEMLVTSFDMKVYGRHLKGGIGIMGTRDAGEPESGRSHGKRTKLLPQDAEIVQGRHVQLERDGRCACNDVAGVAVRPELMTTALHTQCGKAGMALLQRRRSAFRASEKSELSGERGYHAFPFCAQRSRLPTGKNGECEFDLNVDTEYLPHPLLLDRARSGPSREWYVAEVTVLRRLRALQNPHNCSAPVSADYRRPAWTVASGGAGAEGRIVARAPEGKPDDPGSWHLLKWCVHFPFGGVHTNHMSSYFSKQ